MEQREGYVEHIIFRNEENFYTVFEMESTEGKVTCTGNVPAISEGESCLVKGSFVNHTVYGEQFRVELYEPVAPKGAEAMLRYLSSGAVKGIGEALARRIVKKFGADTMRIMDEEPERLAEIKGISERKAREIAAQMEDKRELRDAMLFLQQYGVTNRTALKIWKGYGMEMYRVLRENPYQLAEDIDGIGFATADEIAARAGIAPDSDFRVRSGILYVLSLALGEGSSYLPRQVLLGRTQKLLQVPVENMEIQLHNLAVDRRLRIRRKGEEVQIYSNAAWRQEQQIARMLADLDAEPVHGSSRPAQEILRELEEEEEIELDALQREAVITAADHGILIISGGPGTGKTTTINTLIRFFDKEHMTVLLAAPTGRAARRMTEATGCEAMTIHRLLGVRTVTKDEENVFATDAELAADSASFSYFDKNSENPLEADVIIIDEMSMVDMRLFHSLLRAIVPGTRLIMVGDHNQLPSVGPGRILQDLIESGVFRTIMLRKIFRQAMESDIVQNAHKILSGEHPAMDNRSKDFFFLERDQVPVIYKHTVELLRGKLPQYLGCSEGEIQVMTPMRKGLLGVERLNEILQSVLNPPHPGKAEIQRRDITFREGDKVMQTRNNYQIEWEIRGDFGLPLERGTGIFNGESGYIRAIDRHAETLEVCFEDEKMVEYPFAELDDLDLAYAITVHKSQGSEYPAVILPIMSGPPGLFNRNLLYTAVTRAKGCVVILGSRRKVEEMIDNTRMYSRYTGLKERIHEITGLDEDSDRSAFSQEVPLL